MPRTLIAVAALLISTAASAADLPRREAPPSQSPADAWSWTGVYAGVHAGYAWGGVAQRQTSGGMPEGPFSYDVNGFFGGATAGFNYQTGWLVLGIEGDLGWMDLSGKGIIPSSNPKAHQDITLKGGLYADLTARLGVAMGSTLLYGKGGFAYLNGEARQQTTNPGFVTHGTDGAFKGWVLGGGVEHAITRTMTLKVEYLHFDFGHKDGDQTSVTDVPIGFVYTNRASLTADTVKAGLNWKY